MAVAIDYNIRFERDEVNKALVISTHTRIDDRQDSAELMRGVMRLVRETIEGFQAVMNE